MKAPRGVIGARVPVVVLLAVDAAVLAEAGELGLQVEFTLAALEAAHVPLFVHGQQVVAVRDLPPTARAQSHALAAHTRHGLQANKERGARTRGVRDTMWEHMHVQRYVMSERGHNVAYSIRIRPRIILFIRGRGGTDTTSGRI